MPLSGVASSALQDTGNQSQQYCLHIPRNPTVTNSTDRRISSQCTARRYITVVVLTAAYCRTVAASLLAACSSYASAGRILHDHYLPLLPLAAALELTIHTSVQGSPPERAKGSVLLHLDMNTYEYLCCWCGRTY